MASTDSDKGRITMRRKRDQRGFALVVALLANLILLAVGIVALNLSTADIRISVRAVGDKKAVNAAEAGLHWMTVNFDPANPAAVAVTDKAVETSPDPNTKYTITQPTEPTTGPAQVTLPGYNMAVGLQGWGMARYDATITGRNTAYNTSVTIDVGIGHGPVEMGTMSR
jgi:Tfp pilus assembly protein PilX